MANRASKPSGFTIIEVMIVLAIAGLIMLIVFLAVPALERDTRNTERKHDAALLVTARQEYDEENGTVLQSGSLNCGTGEAEGGSFADFCDYITQGFTYYTPTDVNIIDNGYTTPTTIPTPDAETIYTETYLTCNSDMTGATVNGADPASIAVLFALETSGGNLDQQCIEGGYVPNA